MKRNMSNLDRIIRAIIFAVSAYLYFGEVIPAPWNLVAIIAGGVLLATSLINFCPIYIIFGISTCKV